MPFLTDKPKYRTLWTPESLAKLTDLWLGRIEDSSSIKTRQAARCLIE